MWPFSRGTKQKLAALEDDVHQLRGMRDQEQRSKRSSPTSLPVVFYADEPTLTQLAASKGIHPSSVKVELGQVSTESLARSGGFSASAFGLKSGVNEEAQQTSAEEQRLVLQQHTGIQHIFDSTVAALVEDGQVRCDLLDLPGSARAEADLLRSLQLVEGQWKVEIVDTLDETSPPGEEAEVLEVEDPGTGATGATEASIRTLKAVAHIVVQQEKAKEYAQLAKNGELTFLEGTWQVVDDSARGLCLQPVSAFPIEWLPPDIRPLLHPIYVVIHADCLTDQGRSRLVPGSHIWAAVLGTASFEGNRVDQHVGEARVAPITIVGDLARP